ncbi:MAG: DNA translocase FtsK [Candidatus Cloacimonadales bacterium]
MSKKEPKEPKETNSGIGKILISLIFLVISILMFVAVLQDSATMSADYEILQRAEINFFKFVKLDFPQVQNMIGPFGAFFGFWLIEIFGRFFSLSLILAIFMVSFFHLFKMQDENLVGKILAFVFFAFFLNLMIFAFYPEMKLELGIVPLVIYTVLENLFNRIGTVIISFVIALSMLIFILEVENVKKLLLAAGSALRKLFSGSDKAAKKSKKPKKANKPKAKEKKSKPKKQAAEKKHKPKSLNIIDHAEPKEEEEKKQLPVAPQPVRPRKLSQNSAEKPESSLLDFDLPKIENFLTSEKLSKRDISQTKEEIQRVSGILQDKLAEFGVDAEVKNVNIGPVITQYEIEPAAGVKVSKFNSLADDLALAIKAKSIRVQAPIPGRGLVGIEIPNIKRDIIYLKDVLEAEPDRKKYNLAIGLGKDISGNPIVTDLARTPHLLIAGATGSGKSVCINTIIVSLLLQYKPEELRLILVDPKRIELSGYEGIPHLIQNVVTNNEDALTVLEWGVAEMERRYQLLQKYRVKNLESYNIEIKELRKADPEIEDEALPYIVMIIDELADLMMTVGRDIEQPITRLAQMARAIGIHLILATQRPSSQVITGVIKANFPSRIAFKVASKIDSRVVLDANGADKLLGMGDSLYIGPGTSTLQRIHGAFIKTKEINNLVDFLRTQPKPEQEIKIIPDEEEVAMGAFDYDDDLFPEAAAAVVLAGQASVSMLQRHFKVGYARAGRLIDMLEQAGIVGPHVGSKPREVTATEEDLKIYGYIKE